MSGGGVERGKERAKLVWAMMVSARFVELC